MTTGQSLCSTERRATRINQKAVKLARVRQVPGKPETVQDCEGGVILGASGRSPGQDYFLSISATEGTTVWGLDPEVRLSFSG